MARQEADCRKLAEDRGLTVSEVYVDNDLSAYSAKPRPGYKALLGSARDGIVVVMVACIPTAFTGRLSSWRSSSASARSTTSRS